MAEPAQEPPAEPRFGRWMGAMWLYTLLRFGLFFVLWGLLYLFGVRGLLAALIALVLSVPLSFVLLARPRAAFAAQLEARAAVRRRDRAELDAELDPESHTHDE